MLKNILNIEGLSVLDKTEQSKVVGQACSVFFRTENGNFWSSQTYTVEQAQAMYGDGNGDPLWTFGGASVTGYCCQHCHSFPNHPAHHAGDQGPMYASL